MSGSARTADHFGFSFFLSFFLYILPDPLSSIIGRCTLYTPGFTSTFGIYTDLSFLLVISGICQFPETTPLRRNFVF